MSIWRFLGLAETAAPAAPGNTESVRRIAAALGGLDHEQARYVAAFAYVLGRVANSDLGVSDVERAAMRRLLVERGGLDDQQAEVAVEIALAQNLRLGSTEDYLVTREFAKIATLEQKRALLDCACAIGAADEGISLREDTAIRQIAEELGMPHSEFIAARSRFREHLNVLRPRPDGD